MRHGLSVRSILFVGADWPAGRCPGPPPADEGRLRQVRWFIGDSGHRQQRARYAVANQLTAFRAKFPFDFAIMLGDNLYGGE